MLEDQYMHMPDHISVYARSTHEGVEVVQMTFSMQCRSYSTTHMRVAKHFYCNCCVLYFAFTKVTKVRKR